MVVETYSDKEVAVGTCEMTPEMFQEAIKITKEVIALPMEKRRSLRAVVKRAPFQYPVPISNKTSKYKPKAGFRHRASFRTKAELREEILDLKHQIGILSSKLEASIKKEIALKRKLDYEMASKMGTKRKSEDFDQLQHRKKIRLDDNFRKRKAEDVGENTPPKKVYKIGRSKNVIKNQTKEN